MKTRVEARLKRHEALFAQPWWRRPTERNCSNWLAWIDAGSRGAHHALGKAILPVGKTTPGFQVYSQNAQDGILRAIFERIGVSNMRFVEFGFGYEKGDIHQELTDDDLDFYMSGLNTRLLAKRGWKGTYFDAETQSAKFDIRKSVLTEANIAEHFRNASVPTEVDYVSIDVDSIDLWLMLGMLRGGFRPRVISSEFNPNFGAESKIAWNQTWRAYNWRSMYGASAAALNHIATKFNYRALHMMPNLDIFFVRIDVLEQACDLDTVPTFAQLAKGKIPSRAHFPCEVEDAMWMVDVPLLLEGKLQAAHERAAAEILRAESQLSALRAHKLRPKCCQRTGTPICAGATLEVLSQSPYYPISD
eukprot:CAMPEP_0119311286 /NCGR_PEP_ID=MMETSP1333-20130426/22022_1 /TAXON_ID=418940 /ORGANISM="Scyphosphaera apsteinii, Strain RCC1455" /LENGTH=360 /DNA_ID=CAMNT_0007315631 /DNA_START=218 /DNA_END=1300 /DNA_ORIENTATION=-